MNWEDILKAKSRAKGGGSKPDRRKVERLKRKDKLDELDQDIRARKHGKESEIESPTGQEEPLDWDEPTDEEYDKWMSKIKPGTDAVMDEEQANKLKEIGERKIEEDMKTIVSKFTNMVKSRGFEPFNANTDPNRGDSFRGGYKPGTGDKVHSKFMGELNDELLIQSYNFANLNAESDAQLDAWAQKNGIHYFKKEVEYEVRRATGRAPMRMQRQLSQDPGKMEISTEKYAQRLPPYKKKKTYGPLTSDVWEINFQEAQEKKRRKQWEKENREQINKVTIVLAFQIYPEWKQGWKLHSNVFKFSTAFEKDRVAHTRQKETKRVNIPSQTLLTAGKNKHLEYSEPNVSTILSDMKSFFSYYLRL